MKKYIVIFVILITAIITTGCSTYHSFILPTEHKSEVEYVLDKFNKMPNLKNHYKIKILTQEEMNKMKTAGSPFINDQNTIIIDDLYLKYLYNHRGGKFYCIRKRDLACIIAHEICHREYNLPDKPLEVHFEVDKRAVEMLRQFNIDWHDYSGALIRANDYMKTRGGDFAYFVKNIPNIIGVSSALYFGVGILWEQDLLTRFYLVNEYYGGQNWYNNKELGKKTQYDFTRKTDWDFN